MRSDNLQGRLVGVADGGHDPRALGAVARSARRHRRCDRRRGRRRARAIARRAAARPGGTGELLGRRLGRRRSSASTRGLARRPAAPVEAELRAVALRLAVARGRPTEAATLDARLAVLAPAIGDAESAASRSRRPGGGGDRGREPAFGLGAVRRPARRTGRRHRVGTVRGVAGGPGDRRRGRGRARRAGHGGRGRRDRCPPSRGGRPRRRAPGGRGRPAVAGARSPTRSSPTSRPRRPGSTGTPARRVDAWAAAASGWDTIDRPYYAADRPPPARRSAPGATGESRTAIGEALRPAAATARRLGAAPLLDRIRRLARLARVELPTTDDAGDARGGPVGRGRCRGRLTRWRPWASRRGSARSCAGWPRGGRTPGSPGISGSA